MAAFVVSVVSVLVVVDFYFDFHRPVVPDFPGSRAALAADYPVDRLADFPVVYYLVVAVAAVLVLVVVAALFVAAVVAFFSYPLFLMFAS